MEIIFDRDIGCNTLVIIQVVLGEDRKIKMWRIFVFIVAGILAIILIAGIIAIINEVTKQVSQVNVADMVKEQIVCGVKGMLGMRCD